MGPEFILTTASAGSGKTYKLSLRFAEFLLTEAGEGEIPRGLSHILAITFTRNAAREMKVRVLEWLKEGYRAKGTKAEELLARLEIKPAGLSRRAEEAVERILANYTDFRVDTIDSFAAMVFRASAVDLGYGPDFEISLNPRELLDYAFARYLRRVSPDSEEGGRFRRILEYLLLQEGDQAKFLWDPGPKIGEKLAAFLKKLAGRTGELVLDDCRREKAEIGDQIRTTADRLKRAVQASGLEVTTTGHYAKKILPAVEAGDFSGLIDCSFKTFPVKARGKAKGAAAGAVEEIGTAWTALEDLAGEYARWHARDFFLPYLQAYRDVQEEMDSAKRGRGLLFLDDVNRKLYRYLERGIIPDVYFRLGDRIFHYLIDEFQDTAPIQWAILKPLIEESLGQGGSLFLVGDRKQAIYGFRDADFRIMSRLERGEEAFESVPTSVRELSVNFRSEGEIQAFVKDIFLGLKPRPEADEAGVDDEIDYGRLAELSGLNHFEQHVLPEREGRGYVRYILLDQGGKEKSEPGQRAGEDAAGEGPDRDAPEKKEIQDLVAELAARKFSWSDIAILAYRNDEVAEVASWLNERDIPIVSFSNLDIRRRKVIGEILSFLRFLDAPPDDLALAGFLLGDLFSRLAGADFGLEARREFLRTCYREETRPCYTALRRRFPGLWKQFFEPMFNSVGYLPLYDLVTRMYREFDVFRLFPGEEAALTKLLEAIKGFEGEGRNDLREFLEFSAGEEDPDSIWTIDVPRETEAVKIMSIHKAKGSTIPVVICLLYGQAFKGGEFYLDDDEAGVHVYKINKASAAASAELARIYGEARDREWVDRLNSLYVALTRAQYELYIVGVKGKRGRYPFDLLAKAFDMEDPDPEPDREIIRRAGERGKAAGLEFYRPPASGRTGGETGLRQKVEHRSGFTEPTVDIRESLDPSGIRRGEWIHRILAGIEFAGAGWSEDVAASLAALAPSLREKTLADEAGEALVRAAGRSIDPAWFAALPGRSVSRELDVCDAGGDVYRMDRVVVDPETVLVVDFKTGRRPLFAEEYREQIRRYCRLMKDVFPDRTVRGLLSFLDQDRIEEVP